MHFYQIPRHEILFQLPVAQGWALHAWAIQNNGGSEVEIDGDGYIAQEAWRRRQKGVR
jgi:hypothetical protein